MGLEFIPHTVKGSSCPPNDLGIVAVIDGSELHVYASYSEQRR